MFESLSQIKLKINEFESKIKSFESVIDSVKGLSKNEIYGKLNEFEAHLCNQIKTNTTKVD